ncbi:MAG: phosphodiester glycosidase family protein [Tannerella sp.]|jgi:exopolysaccharide biosynthesis protein|nr:phosphodiester glycosidase family protein [Tannerella sp.]
MKSWPLIVTILLLQVCISCVRRHSDQTTESETSQLIQPADWTIRQITEDITLQQVQTELFDSKQSISVLIIRPEAGVRIGINDTANVLVTTSELCRQMNAVAGVNASFFDMTNGGAVDFVRVNGEVKHNAQEKHERSNAALAISDREIKILGRDSSDTHWEEHIEAEDVIIAGPLIMKDGIAANLRKNAFNNNRHPRTFVATRTDGAILLVVVDGRNAHAAGMSLNELFLLARSLNCKDVMNLDGGGSSTMYVRGEGDNGIVNYPSDNKQFDHYGERPVANVIYIADVPTEIAATP